MPRTRSVNEHWFRRVRTDTMGAAAWKSACGMVRDYGFEANLDPEALSCPACLEALFDRLIARRVEIGMAGGTKARL